MSASSSPDKRPERVLLLDVFGREVRLELHAGCWQAFYCGTEGKKRPAGDIVLPPGLPEQELAGYIADICHEWARPGHQDVVICGEEPSGLQPASRSPD